jgi:murein DD-endopeptidase MepM/ murein hydrolase activator NlpD
LGYVAQIYATTVDVLVELNNLASADFLTAGQVLLVPGGPGETTPAFKLLPDSELVYGPRLQDFDVAAYVAQQGGYLSSLREEVEGRELGGAEIVQLLADRYSVGPRLLLAYIEHRLGWVTGGAAAANPALFGFRDNPYEGLYWQLAKAADAANYGFYGRSEGGVDGFTLADGLRLTFAPEINAGTAGVQFMLGAGEDVTATAWRADVAPGGFFATYQRLFGNPFAYAYEPLWPDGLSQPAFTLPWPGGETWYFTGGPHGGWAGGSAWAALDFVPGGDLLGCYDSDAWVTAMAPGVVVRSDLGAVVVDLDGDGYAGSGWVVVYMHLATRDRAAAGSYVQPGDPLGHPSCEGGFSNGTHVHVARLYNGRWVAADGAVPFSMDGWVSQGLGREYDGLLVKGEEVREACVCREPLNEISR